MSTSTASAGLVLVLQELSLLNVNRLIAPIYQEYSAAVEDLDLEMGPNELDTDVDMDAESETESETETVMGTYEAGEEGGEW